MESDAPFNGVCDIKSALSRMKISEDDILANFVRLTSKAK